MIQAASIVRRLARNAANLFRRSLESEVEITNKKRHQQLNSDEEDEDDEDLLDRDGEGPTNLELLLNESIALQLLAENLSLFIHPDPVRKALFKIWPVLHPRDCALEIENNVEWEVPRFLAACFSDEQELGNVLTVTGETFNAQAQSCGDYLAQTWPEIGPVLLDGLHEMFSHGISGEKDPDGWLAID